MNVTIIVVVSLSTLIIEIVNSFDLSYIKYQNPLERIFTRKRRFIVFPNYASMKITVAMGKSLIAKYPRGVNLSLELSLYYALPTILEEWYPKEYRSSTTEKPKVKKNPFKGNKKMENEMNGLPVANIGENYPIHSEGGTIWIEDDVGWYPNNINSSFATQPEEFFIDKQRIWNEDKEYNSKKYSTENYYHMNKWNKNRKTWIHPSQEWQSKNSNASINRENMRPFYNQDTENELLISKYPVSPWMSYNKKSYYPTIKNNWKHLRAHRDRRDIYDKLEGFGSVFDIDIKSCILRSICESKKYLLPQGYSLIQDILRTLFTFPNIDGMTDEFSETIRSDQNNCETKYKNTCAISILDMALNPDKIN